MKKPRGRTAKAPPRRPLLRRLFRLVLRWSAFAALAVVLWVAAYRWIDPPGGLYMLSERVRLGGISREWRDLDAMSPNLPRAAMAAEDARFCAHDGFDFEAIRAALEANAEGGRIRGGSTISQQVAKNVFLWHDRSWLRKGLEAGFTVLIEALWSKRRILEVYLNVAEFDAGVFGVGAAARHHFGEPADRLTAVQAGRLMAVLPNPQERNPARPSDFVRKRGAAIARGAEDLRLSGRDGCVFGD